MIKSVWKPHYNRSKVILYELVDKVLLETKKGTTAFKVIWTCDNPSCKNPDTTHSINACHLLKDKMNIDCQICRPCQCSGEGNGRYGDRRKWDDFFDNEELIKMKLKYSQKWLSENNPSKKDEIKIKKNQNIINETFLKKIVDEKNFKLVSILKIDGKKSKIVVECSYGHQSEKTYVNFIKKGKKFICQKCFYNSIGLNLNDEQIQKFENYKKQVRALTAKTYKLHKNLINPYNLKIGRGFHHIDHKFSVYEGFKNDIIPSIISAKENLEILTEKNNCSKGAKCSITFDVLFEKTKYLLLK
jgi:rhodanese-related sulfurtransferase